LAEEAVESVVGSGHEALRLLAVPSPQDPHDGRLQIVVSDAPRHSAERFEGTHVAVDEHLLGLVEVDAVIAPPPTRRGA
jgi:hypothetical protein